MNEISELIDAAARAAVEHDAIPAAAREAFADMRERPDGLYTVPDAAWRTYSNGNASATREGAFRWWNGMLAGCRAANDAEADGLSAADVEIASIRARSAAREKINAAIERGDIH